MAFRYASPSGRSVSTPPRPVRRRKRPESHTHIILQRQGRSMKAYLISLAAGLLVGVIYNLLNVRSPAPPVIASSVGTTVTVTGAVLLVCAIAVLVYGSVTAP